MHVDDRLPTRRCLSKSSAEANDAYGAREATVRLTVRQAWLSPSDRKRAAVVKMFQVLRGRLPATARKLEVVKVRCNVRSVAPTKKTAKLTRMAYFAMNIRICNVNEYYLSTSQYLIWQGFIKKLVTVVQSLFAVLAAAWPA